MCIANFITCNFRFYGFESRSSLRHHNNNIGLRNLETELTYQPFDVVYTWVNGSDPKWRAKKELWSKPKSSYSSNFNETLSEFNNTTTNSTSDVNATTIAQDDRMSLNRYRDSEELRYSLRSLVKNAPWIRHIYLVTDNQIPYWLNLETTKLTIISHEEIFPNKSHLPVFSSPAIESNLHRIPGLSKKFIYFNDDVFLGMKVLPEDFISLRGAQRLIMSWDVPKCAPGCSDSWIGDGFCDKACNVSACNFDYPDCVNGTNSNQHGGYHGNTRPSSSLAMCTKGCPDNWLADKICDMRCKSEECGYDVGDCGLDLVTMNFAGVEVNRHNARIYTTPEISESFSYGSDYLYGPSDMFFSSHEGGGEEGEEVEGRDGVELLSLLESEGLGLDETYVDNSTSSSTGISNSSIAGIEVASLTTHTSTQSEHHTINTGLQRSSSSRTPLAPALTVEYGTKAVYFDLGYLACMYSTNTTCAPENVTDVIYDNVEQDDEMSRVVHISTILTRHHTLIVLLYHGQEGAPEPSWDYFDVKFTLVVSSSTTGESNTVVFTMRMIPPLGDKQKYPNEMLPEGMSLLENNVMIHSCNSEEVKHFHYRHNSGSSDIGQLNHTLHLTWKDNSVILPQPYREIHHNNDNKSNNIDNNNANNDNNDNNDIIVMEEGAIAALELIPNLSQRDLLYIPINHIYIQYTVTTIDGHIKQLNLLLLDALLGFNRNKTISSSVIPPSFDSIRNTWKKRTENEDISTLPIGKILDFSEENYYQYQEYIYSRGPARSPRFASVPAAIPYDHAQKERLDINATSIEPSYHVYMKLPMPVQWSTVAEPAWMHVQAEIMQFMQPILNSREIQWNQWYSKTNTMSSNVNGSSISTTNTNEVACIGAAVLWGSIQQAPNRTIESIFTSNSTNNSSSSSTAMESTGQHSNTSLIETAHAVTTTVPSTIENTTTTHIIHSSNHSNSNDTVIEEQVQRRLDEIEQVSFLTNFINTIQTTLSSIYSYITISYLQYNENQSQRRRLEDTFGQSLVHVNRLYNKEFGTEGRKVPAHVPHMIDRDYMNEMQLKWSEQWNATSSHRFRSPTDMQYSFSYYYYLMNRHKIHPHDLYKYISTTVDSNRDGYINENEFRTIASMVKSSASPTDIDLFRMLECVSNSSNTFKSTYTEKIQHKLPYGTVYKSFSLQLYPTINEILNCTEISEGLRKYINWNNIFPSHIVESDKELVAFEMIGDNYTISLSQLDSIRARQSKFICINDNMNNPTPEMERALRSFFESFFPEPSIFELPSGKSNPTLYLDEYKELQRQKSKGFVWISNIIMNWCSNIVGWCWNTVREPILSTAHYIIDIISDDDGIIKHEDDRNIYVHELRSDIYRHPRIHKISGQKSSLGLGKTVLYLSVIGVVGIVALRILSKRR